MNSVGFATTYSLVDLLEELPLPKALDLKENDRLTNEPLSFNDMQELQNVASIIAPAIQIARLPSDIDRLRFKPPLAPSIIRTHHAQASPLMSLVVAHYNQFQDILTTPPFYHVPAPAPPPPQPLQPLQQPLPTLPTIPPQPLQQLQPPQPQPPQPPPPKESRPIERPIIKDFAPKESLPKVLPPKEYAIKEPALKKPAFKESTPSKRPKDSSTKKSPTKAYHAPLIDEPSANSLEETLERLVADFLSKSNAHFSPRQLVHLVGITAKLKKKGHTKNINLNKLTTLILSLSSQLHTQTELLRSGDNESDIMLLESCCDCSVTALNIMTSSGMDSKVYLEECIEAIIDFINIALTIGSYCPSPKKQDRSPKKSSLNKQSLAKCSEVLSLIHDLLVCRTESILNDSLLLSTSRAALTAFFLMDSSNTSNELQLNALNVITAIFSAYRNHQNIILEELIHSIARLPTTKRNRVQYQMGPNNSGSISIFSALIMKLIQSLFTIRRHHLNEEKSSSQNQPQRDDGDGLEFERILKNQYNAALRASYAFLSSFLRRCCGVDKKDDNDYRVLFETFVEDLMTCLYKPDWSSAQLITHVLIKLLIANINPQPGKKYQQASNQSLKLASLDHLGTLCARLIKEKSTLLSHKKEVKRALKAINLSSVYSEHSNEVKSKRLRSKLIKEENMSESETEDEEDDQQLENNSEVEEAPNSDVGKILSKTDEQKFWLALLTFCQREKVMTKCGRNIFCAIWIKELERRAKSEYEINNPALVTDSVSDDEETDGDGSRTKQSSRNERGQNAAQGPSVEEIQGGYVRDFFRLLNIASKARYINIESTGEIHGASVNHGSTNDDSTIHESTASSIIKLLDVSLPTTQKLIDASLSHVVAAISTTANTNIRSKAMKSLSHVLNNAPQECAASLLARDDLQKAIGASLLDQSTSVRESTVELIGRFILNSQSEKLISRYYDMLTNRIMDSGVSVRKRVIKILREICTTYPQYPRVPEICSIIIKRINDEGEGIRKLVSETFTQMWFKEEHTHEAIVAKVACITHVVATVWSKILADTAKSTGAESHFEWLHQLMSSLLRVKPNVDDHANKKRTKVAESDQQNEDGEAVPVEVVNVKQTLAAATQIIAVLVSDKLSNGSQESTSRADCLAAVTTLWSFAKISPLLLTQYLDVFQSFLHVEPKSSFDLLILEKVIQIIELVLPSISNPSASTMHSIETNLGKLIIRGSMRVVSVSVSCISELIHRHSHNEQLANEMFIRFLSIIRTYRANSASFGPNRISHLLRALYTCGLLAKHFNLEKRDILYGELVSLVETSIREKLYEPASQGMRLDEQILLKSLEGLGFMFERSPGLMLRDTTTKIYRYFMSRAIDPGHNDSASACICVITNLRNYLQDEVTQEIKSASSIDWSRENLKEMTSSKQEDANSTQSSVIQLYLRDMLSCALSSHTEIRKASIKLIHGVHNGGHVNPLSIVPSLIALSSDDDSTIRVRAAHVLQEIERKYNNFVNMKSKQGVFESFILNRGKRGFHWLSSDAPTQGAVSDPTIEQSSESASNDQNATIQAKLSNLYSVIATNRQQRRAFINALLRYFDMQTLSSAPNMLSNDLNESKMVLSKCVESDMLLYVIDNLMFLPFTLQDEPFFLIHQIGISMSSLVSQAVSQFREILQLSIADDEEAEDEEEIEIKEGELSDDSTEDEMTDEEEDPENRKQRKLIEKQERLRQRKIELRQRKLQQRGFEQNLMNAIEAQDNYNDFDNLPVSIMQVKELVASLHRCILLMHCKRVIWDLYGVTDQKFEDYTPNESTKVTDKPIHRRSHDEQNCETFTKLSETTVHFDSSPFLKSVYSEIFGFEDTPEIINYLEQRAPNRQTLKLEYKRFSQLMTK